MQDKLAADEGFQKALELYNALSAKQVKTIFMTLGMTRCSSICRR